MPNNSFLALIDTELKREQAAKEVYYKDRPYAHYPSSASCVKPDGSVVGACLRNLYWRATKEPVDETADTLASVLQRGFGDAIHTWLSEKLKKVEGLSFTPEVPGKWSVDGLTREVSYRMDGLATIDGKKGGLEIKTTQGRGLEYMIKEGGPKEAHMLQTLDYLGANPELSFFNLVYVARDSGFNVEYRITRESEGLVLAQVYPSHKALGRIEGISVEGTNKRRKELEEAVVNKTLPKRDFAVFLNKDGGIQDVRTKGGERYKSDFMCLYCDYAKKCWSMPDAKNYEKRIV